ncbi:MAG: hypothetical protein HKN91_14505 [Acidimicrobiia bacterium]|nr:hypothetical protein [Acidimicrobiia bacterium]
MGWTVSTDDVVHFDDAAPHLQTGDLALFHGNSWISRGIQRATRSPYSHIGMVVRYSDIARHGGGPLLAARDDEVYFFESMLARQSLPDMLDPVWDEERHAHETHSGVQLVSLRDAFCTYDSQKLGAFSIRRLQVPDRSRLDLAALRDLMDTIDKKPYPRGAVVVAHWIEGRLGIPAAFNDFFCAELVALCYEALGLLTINVHHNPANKYSPGEFSSHQGINLHLDAELEAERVITVDDCHRSS